MLKKALGVVVPAFFPLSGILSGAEFVPVWQLGADDSAALPFGSENYSPNAAPGSATARDDDYYLAGVYPAPIGARAADEPLGNFERAITSGDPRDRVHFHLDASQVSGHSRLRVTLDLFGGGAWVGYSLPGFGSHDVAIRLNGVLIGTRANITWDAKMVITVPASTVNAVAGANVLQIERTGGTGGGWIQFDYLKLEGDVSGLADADGDGMPEWFETTFGLSDGDPDDADDDPDGDGLDNLGEFQRGTNATAADTDSDGIADFLETTTSPLIADSDGDGIEDGDETVTNPASADSDADGVPDNIELERGSDPMSAASKPFDFPGAIGFQFISESLVSAALKPGEPAGYIPLPHWNASPPQPKWNAAPYTGSAAALKNHRGQPTTTAVSWSARSSSEGFHRGSSDENLLSGMVHAGMDGANRSPATLDISGIPYPVYDLIVYVGHIYPGYGGYVQRGADAASRRYFMGASNPPFPGWIEAKATSAANPPGANYVRYRGLSGATQTIALHQLTDDSISIHGFQIIDSGTDTDTDGMKDIVEWEHGFDPESADANADADLDGSSNAAEVAAGTRAHDPDTDDDGIPDGAEATHQSNPLVADTDGDGLTDGDEALASTFPSLANVADSDGDGYSDAAERRGKSDPMNALSKPPGVPAWNATTRTWTWVTKPLRIRWDHDLSMVGAIPGDETMICESIVNRAGTGWNGRIGLGVRYLNGRVTHRFYCGFEVFHPAGFPANGFWNSDWVTYPVDRKADLGLSGYGSEDDSAPMSFEFTATRPNASVNQWTLVFKLLNVANPASPVTIATWTQTNAVAAHGGLLDGTMGWADVAGNPGSMTIETEYGVRAYFDSGPLGPPDSDNDGLPDAWESSNGLLPNNAGDADDDPDGDGLVNRDEWRAGTNPQDADTDDDGVKDRAEVDHGSDPLSAASVPLDFTFDGDTEDLDGDGLSDAWVLWSGGRHRAAGGDDDGDGVDNRKESIAGTDPDDAGSKLVMGSAAAGDDLLLSWTDLPFKTHRILSGEHMDDWEPAAGMIAQPSAGGLRHALAQDVLAAGGRRFYVAEIGSLDSDNDGVEDWTEVNVLGSSPASADSLGKSMVRGNGQVLSGDALALQQRMRGSSPGGGIPGATQAGMPSPVQASRFLMQATFGPVPEDIEAVRDLGYEGWIDQQLQLSPSYLQPYIRQIKADGAGPRADRTYCFNELDRFIHGNNITTPFARNAVGAPDQLRQRVAFALSQILVVSRRDAQLEEKAEAMACYYDVLIRHALGNYRDVLMDITFNPAMGWYLSHAGNQKGDPSVPRYPDENYAREVMQLFTIGLWELNPDGSRKLDPAGDPIPTYGNAEITEMARVFTGLYFDAPYGWNGGGWADEHYTKPMVMYPQHHDFGTKTLLKGFVLPESEESTENGVRDVKAAVDSLFRHPNTPPFVCRQLIQFLVTDNPSPAYIRRVQDVFVDNGAGTRGDLAAVVKAILLDPEAREAPISPEFGKAREPVVRTMHLGRLFKLAKNHPKFVWWNWNETFYGSSVQEPMNSPSVFNFYTPSYQAPGEIRDSGLVSPVFQIVNTYSAVSFPNLLLDYLHGGFRAAYDWRYPLDFGASLPVAADAEALVDHVDLLVCAGNMTARTRSILLSKLAEPSLTEHDRVALAVWLAMTCPEGAVQR